MKNLLIVLFLIIAFQAKAEINFGVGAGAIVPITMDTPVPWIDVNVDFASSKSQAFARLSFGFPVFKGVSNINALRMTSFEGYGAVSLGKNYGHFLGGGYGFNYGFEGSISNEGPDLGLLAVGVGYIYRHSLSKSLDFEVQLKPFFAVGGGSSGESAGIAAGFLFTSRILF